MGIDPQLLGQGEHEVLSLRTHAKALIRPVLVLLVIAAIVGAAFALLPPAWTAAAWWVLVGLAVVAIVIAFYIAFF